MKSTATDRKKYTLIRRYHTLCTQLGISEEDRQAMLANNYGVESSKELYVEELERLCRVLATTSNPIRGVTAKTRQEDEMDKARKRVIAVIFSWLSFKKYKADIRYVKQIACNATRCERFNDIPHIELRKLYRIFGDMKSKEADMWVNEVLNKVTEEMYEKREY